ncbi:M24 family metallopeptidase [Halobacterium wangiae]|uniref:M24 family metallopeptidase n=1 Tax=Halobacterium wangiae TaxID=2902623 RepID=UPI001E6315FC|nr:Xaa-Pro peptidase family protein [Halobacterium wangiae]
MNESHSHLEDHLDEAGTDGYLVDADGEDSNQYYLSGYHAPDDFVTLYADGAVRLLVPPLESTRASADTDADSVRTFREFGFADAVADHGRTKARPVATAGFLAEYGVDSVSVPVSFPTGTAEVLRDHGIEVVTDYDDVLLSARTVKTDAEIDHIAETQRATEDAMAVAEELLERATVTDGVLRLDGEVLTSERVRRAIEVALLEDGCRVDDCIVAAGADGALSHESGSGPIRAGEPVIVDIYPHNEASRYFGDMTRTFVKGDPDPQVREWYDLTREAFEAALDAIGPGVTGETVHGAVCDVFEREDYPTLRTDESTQDGFFHSTGHGVGLDVHEMPSLSEFGGELQPGHVVTVEPGLYEQGTGGVRLEDLVFVTEDGYENLNDYSRELRVV